MELNRLRLSQIDTSDIESSDFASKTQINSVSSNVDTFASYANATFSTGGDGTATGNGVVFSDSFTTDVSNTYSLIVTSNGAENYDIVLGSDRLSVLTGSQDPNVYIEEGDVISITNNSSGHPLYIKYNSSTGTGDAVPGVINQGADGGTTLIWNTSIGDAGTYYYQCSNHLAMNGYLIVQSAGTYTSEQYYATSNAFLLSQSADYKENLLVYLNGLLQHPDAYTVSGTTLTLINSDPLPLNLKVSVRELSVAGGVANVALANVAEARASNAANGTLTFDYEGANLYVYDGSAVGGYYLSLTQAVVPAPEYSQAQGVISGYASGGEVSGLSYVNTVDKFPFPSNGNATDVGDLTVIRNRPTGQSSSLSGYTSGGQGYSGGFLYYNVIDKFSFSADGNATDVGDLTQTRFHASGQSSSSSGYTSGGSTAIPNTFQNTVDKFSFSADGNATDVGNLSVARFASAGQSSTESGYASGGQIPAYSNVIDKFPFAVDANSTDVGDLTQARAFMAGQSSLVSGYTSGGIAPPTINTIDKFPFSTDANATDVGDLLSATYGVAGQSSDASGYASGGSPVSNVIQKFPFSTDANSTDVGDLTQSRYDSAGQQV